jgi:hypothetical protein
MFQAAYKLAREFTRPVVISQKSVSGACSSIIGSFVVVNRSGWIVTACHIFEAIEDIRRSKETVGSIRKSREVVEAEETEPRERRRKLNKIGMPSAQGCEAWSAWWGGFTHSRARDIAGLPDIDLAVARLDPFDPSWVTEYPVFKNPQRDFEPGRALCKFGYPFHQITPSWDAASGVFVFPDGALPLPLFPIEGMFTRIAKVAGVDDDPCTKLLIETSTPGLKGQSGGPTVDVSGRIWAIQSKTANLPLGFDPSVPGRPQQREHQFLNVGLGVHATTILGLLDHLNIGYAVSID